MTDSRELADQFGRTAKVLGARLAARLSDHPLSLPRANLLAALHRDGPARITELGNRVGISQGTASNLSDALVRDELIERRIDTRDGRATVLALTPAGQDAVRAWLADYEQAADEVFGALPDRLRDALLEALRRLADANS